MRTSARQYCQLWQSLIAFVAVLVFLAPPVQAQNLLLDTIEGLFGTKPDGGKNARVVGKLKREDPDKVDLAFRNEFTPTLLNVLAVELYYARKVCSLSDEQLATLRPVGLREVVYLSKEFAESQRQHQMQYDKWPSARAEICSKLAEAIEKDFSAELAEKYESEVTARQAAQRTAARGMMLNVIDRKVALSPEQFAAVDQVIQENWIEGQDRNLMVFSYEDYAPRVKVELLKPHLREPQIQVLDVPNHYGNISFGWQVDLGLAPWENMGLGDVMGAMRTLVGLGEDGAAPAEQIIQFFN